MNIFENCNNLTDIKNTVLKTDTIHLYKGKNWSLFRIVEHCAQTIEFSMIGYPKQNNILIQSTIGKIAIGRFLRKNTMSHSLTAPVPGAPFIPENGDALNSIKTLVGVIDSFLSCEQPLRPHLLFGKLSKEQYDRYFALHLKDHFSELSLK